MKNPSTFVVLLFLVSAVFLLASSGPALMNDGLTAEVAAAGKNPGGKDVAVTYTAMEPITRGNLRVFPVAATAVFDTGKFITLEEGLRSGEVVVSEAGQVQPLVRPRPQRRAPTPQASAEVNRLVLVNNSSRPLLLLAGEIVTGGKQDRVVGKDRIIPPHSEPVDLSVFCVEPGRWSASYGDFATMEYAMAQPNVRKKAMAEKDQQQVWDEVGRANAEMIAAAPAPPPASVTVDGSYARVMNDKEAQKPVEDVVAPIQRSYEGLLKELRARKAVGVVVAVNGEIVWADLFASTALLEKYWPKLIRSYAAEAVSQRHKKTRAPDVMDAQDFLDKLGGKRQVVESEPDIFRHTETSGVGYRVFELTSLLPGTGYVVHVSKMGM